MTLQEAMQAARRTQPIVIKSASGSCHSEIRYKRITQVGVHYDKDGNGSPFLQLIDNNDNSVTYADPNCCEVVANEP